MFDKSRGDPFTFNIGTGQVIKGWDLGMKTMRIGEKAELILKPEYAYGEQGAGADIPPNSTLIFKVEIVQIDSRKAKKFMVSDEDLYKQGLELKDKGNGHFKAKEHEQAVSLYREALIKLNKMEEPTKES